MAACAAAIAFSSLSAAPAALKAGDTAPAVLLRDMRGDEVHFNPVGTSPTLLLSLKAGDRYDTDTLRALRETFQKFPRLKEGLSLRIVVSRIAVEEEGKDESNPEERKGLEFLKQLDTAGWTVLLDPTDEFYRSYKIIATPTVTIVGRDGVVAAVHPGYDAALAQDVRLSLANLLNVPLPATVTTAAEKPNMSLQMARRMAQRGVWDRAISYYNEAREQGALAPADEVDLANVLVKTKDFKAARAILEKTFEEPSVASRAAETLERIRLLESGSTLTPEPPRVVR